MPTFALKLSRRDRDRDRDRLDEPLDREHVVRGIRKAAERGMTLVEIMVVVVIISLVAGTVGVAVFNALETAKIDTTRTQIKQISDALDIYKLSNRQYPSTAEGLNAMTAPKRGKPTMEFIPKDAWGNDFVYIYPGNRNSGKFDLISYGADSAQGGGDDIGNWPEEG